MFSADTFVTYYVTKAFAGGGSWWRQGRGKGRAVGGGGTGQPRGMAKDLAEPELALAGRKEQRR